ncbi:hypothetical protein IWQ60_003635 [Tieghemiomyces parasiticus]|uniref:Major facilitator superfamily (MFS) profile domain-containing protein n=1 Tax=Tieghemiomyces parasiticus TaxID=78921 RepID=A0A9W8ACI0_9FUNG|nr:hypothetical protein IWQ60_003635 [Tieghemiomyces parasiticus]
MKDSNDYHPVESENNTTVGESADPIPQYHPLVEKDLNYNPSYAQALKQSVPHSLDQNHDVPPEPTKLEKGDLDPDGDAMTAPAGMAGENGAYAFTWRKISIIMLGLGMGLFLAFVDMTIVATALPEIGSQLGAFDQITWVASSYMLTSTALQPLYGKLSDIFGRVPAILFALITFLVGCAICGAAQSMITLIIARGLAGIGGAGIVSLSMIIVSDIVPLNKRAPFLAGFGGIFAISSVAGPLMGGAFTEHVSWRWVFYINLPIGAVTLFAIIFFLRIPRKPEPILVKLRRVDYLGTFLLVAGIVLILLATMWGGKDYPWDDKRIISFFVVGGVLIVGFVFAEMYVAVEPILPMRLFRNRNIALCLPCVFFLGFTIFSLIFYLPIFFTVVRGDGATKSGVKLLPLMLSTVVGSTLGGIYVNKRGRCREIIILGAAIATVGMGLITTLKQSSSTGEEIGFLIVLGLGCGLMFQTMLMVSQASATEEDVAVVTACYNFFQTIGGTVGLAILSAIMNNELSKRLDVLPGIDLADLNANPSHIYHTTYSDEVRYQFIEAYVQSLRIAFIAVVPMVGATFLLSLGLKHVPLRKTLEGGAHG